MIRAAALLAGLAALWVAAPAAADPFGGLAPQMRLTSQGPDGAPEFDATTSDLVYNSVRDEFFLVWQGQDARAPQETEIYGRRLNGSGKPIGDVVRISDVGEEIDATATDPAVAYDSERDRYAVVYSAFDQQSSSSSSFYVALQMLEGDGTLLGEPQNLSAVSAALTWAWDADIAFNPLDDQFLALFTFLPNAYPGAPTVGGRLVDAATGTMLGQTQSLISGQSAPDVDAAAAQMSLIWRPDNRYVAAWVQRVDRNNTDWDFRVLVVAEGDGALVANSAPSEITTMGHFPALAADPGGTVSLLAYSTNLGTNYPNDEGEEIYVRSVDETGKVGGPVQVSSAGPGGTHERFVAARPAIAFSPLSGLFLVTWQGNDDARPGLADSEQEISGQMVSASGMPVGNEFLISRMGPRNNVEAGPDGTGQAVAASSRTGEFLAVWSGDDARAPAVQGEHEVWGRRIGPNPPNDLDQDRFAAASDCDDTDPEVHPGALDSPYNNRDEDCSGSDSKDFDKDGYAPPRDCDDTKADVHPGAFDIPGNRRDEDCNGRDRAVRTTARVRAAWFFTTTATTVAGLSVEGAPRGAKVRVRCSGRGCPKLLRGAGRSLTTRGRDLQLTRLLSNAQLRPGAAVTVRVTERGAIGIVERFQMRAGKPPRQATRCLPPGRKQPAPCR